MKIGNREIGKGRTFVIAEIGSNHNQDIKRAFELMDIAKESGADAVKFQSIKKEEMYLVEAMTKEDKALLDQICLREEWYDQISEYARKLDILWTSAPTYLEAVDLLASQEVPFLKIASPQTYGFPQLIKRCADLDIPIVMSTGYCTMSMIERAVKLFEKKENLILLQCTANYPTKPKNVNLRFMDELQSQFGVTVGFSDHTLGTEISVAAVARGAAVIEKHITTSRMEQGPDHFFALEPDEFKQMVQQIRNTEVALGNGVKDDVTNFEQGFREEIEMRLFAKKEIKKGDVFTEDMLISLRGDKKALSSWKIEEVLGKKANQDIGIHLPIEESLLEVCR